MAMRKEDKEIRRLLEKESPKNIVVSFVLAMVFGVTAGLAAMAFREMFETTAIQIIYSATLDNIAQYGGLKRIAQIVAIFIMLCGWVISFMVVWHKIEKAPSMAARIKFGVIAIAISIALFLIFSLVQYLVVGYWPTLTGAV